MYVDKQAGKSSLLEKLIKAILANKALTLQLAERDTEIQRLQSLHDDDKSYGTKWKEKYIDARNLRDNAENNLRKASEQRNHFYQLLEHSRLENERLWAALTQIEDESSREDGCLTQINGMAQDALSHQTEQPDTQHVELRPALRWFAEQMELKLRANDHKGGWNQCSLQYLFEKLDEEVGELSATLTNEETIREAADVANIAMMIADNARQPAPKGEDSNEKANTIR